MNAAEAIKSLEANGSAQTRKTYLRHGITEPMFGVSYAHQYKLAKRIGRDQATAEVLWKSGNHDARVLATLVADPETIKKSTLTTWAGEMGNRCQSGELARLVAQTAYGWELASKWCASKTIRRQWAGWALVAALAMEPSGDPDEVYEATLEAIEAGIETAENFTRYGMNMALIAIGGRNAKLRQLATATAKRIGKVAVDHGDTACKTPEAVPYIAKIWARKTGSAKKGTAKVPAAIKPWGKKPAAKKPAIKRAVKS
jgi:3-methyladenine DNA glycosylase AlkD